MLTFLHLALRRIAEPEIPPRAYPDPKRGKTSLSAPVKPVRGPSRLQIVEAAPST